MGHGVREQTTRRLGAQRRLRDEQECADSGSDAALSNCYAASTLIREYETAADGRSYVIGVTLNGGCMPE